MEMNSNPTPPTEASQSATSQLQAALALATPGEWSDLQAQKGAGTDYWVQVLDPRDPETVADADWDEPNICDALNSHYYATKGELMTECSNRANNLRFIALAHNLLPEVLDENAELKARIAELEAEKAKLERRYHQLGRAHQIVWESREVLAAKLTELQATP